MAKVKTIFTTHEVSCFLGVSLQTVVNWIDSGRLVGFRTPGGHRRVSRHDVLLFMRRQGLPIPLEVLLSDRSKARVLVLEGHADLVDVLSEYLELVGKFDVKVVQTVFDAGWVASSFQPDCFIVDLDIRGLQIRKVIHSMRELSLVKATPIIGLSSGRTRPPGLHSYLPRPVPMQQLVQTINEALHLQS